MQEVELTWERFAKVAWLFFWRLIVMCILGGALATPLFEWLLTKILGYPGPPGLGAIIWLPLLFVALRMMFRKQYAGFRIALVSTNRPTAHLN